jgi:hypothetical protein
VLLLVPAANLLPEIGGDTHEHDELPPARECFDLTAELQLELQLVDGPDELRKPLPLVRAVAPRTVRERDDLLRRGAEVRARRVLVIAREAAHRELDLAAQLLGYLHDGRE